MKDPITSVLVGFGHAGQDLHLRALREIGRARSGAVLAVDPAAAGSGAHGIEVVTSIDEALRRLHRPDQAVFHVAIGPNQNCDMATELIGRGARRLIVEKPLAADATGAHRLTNCARANGARVVPVAVWPHSTATQLVQRQLTGRGRMSIEIHQDKPRASLSARDEVHDNALQIEMPHQVLLAIALGGPVEEIEESALWDCRYGGRTLRGMGGARLRLRHASGATSRLSSDLSSGVRARTLRVEGQGVDVTVEYPTTAEVWTSRIHDRRADAVRQVSDRPLNRFLVDAYRHLTGATTAGPLCPIELHLHALEVLWAAEELVKTEEKEAV